MIARSFTFLTKVLCASLLSQSVVMAQQQQAADFQCGDPSIGTTDIPTGTAGTFSTVVAGAQCKHNNCHFLVPKDIHWHIYPLPAGSTAKQAMYPQGIVQAQVSTNGVLSYYLQDVLVSLGYHKGQTIKAGVSLYIPVDQLQTLSLEGVDQSMQVHAETVDESFFANSGINNETNKPLLVSSSGVDTTVRISSPYWAVQYEESGVDNTAWLDVAAGSTIDVSGVDINAYIQCPRGLTVRASGVDIDIMVQGPVASGRMDGVDVKLEINVDDDNGSSSSSSNACENVTNDGVGNTCRSTNDAFAMEELTCLANTNVGYYSWGWNMSTVGTVFLGVGVFIAVIAAFSACIFCCVRGCCYCGNSKQNKCHDNGLPPYPPAPTVPKVVQNDTFKRSDHDEVHVPGHDVLEAEVLEVSNTAAAPSHQFEELDLENDKSGHNMSPSVY